MLEIFFNNGTFYDLMQVRCVIKISLWGNVTVRLSVANIHANTQFLKCEKLLKSTSNKSVIVNFGFC